MDEKLWKIFANVNHWLEYAEKKNAVIMTVIGLQLTLGKLLITKVDTLLMVAGGFLILSFLITVKSFIPKIKIPGFLKFLSTNPESKISETDNLLFYGHIAKYSVDDYCKKMETYLGEKVKGVRLLENLCEQIVVNSGIAYSKFKHFNMSIWFLFAGQILFFIWIYSSIQP